MGKPGGLGRAPGGKRRQPKQGTTNKKAAAKRDQRTAAAAEADALAAAEVMADLASPGAQQQTTRVKFERLDPNVM